MSAVRISPERKECTKAVKNNPADSMAHYNLGVACGDEGDIDAALESFRKAAALEPGYAPAWFNAGCILLEMQSPQDAVIAFQSAIKGDPQMAPAYFMLGTAYGVMGDDAAALEATERGLEVNPADPQGQMNAGLAAFRIGNMELAMAYYQETLRLAPEATPALVGLARCQRELGKIHDAFLTAAIAADLEPDNLEAMFMAGIYHAEEKTGSTPSVGLAAMTDVFELENPEHRFLFALGLWALGARDEAKDALAEILQVAPGLGKELQGYFK